MSECFWEGGAEEYMRVLMDEHNQTLEQLQAQLADCEEANQKASLENQLKQAKSEYDRKLREIDHSLF